MQFEFEKSKMNSEPLDMGMTLMEILKQNDAKSARKKKGKDLPSLELHE
tara:strand:+ start:923 stop:1069 length:147 start_codon:yes stop_codon:yes gene_type:complete